ncbi:MAG: helix-turn-helix transcriptional regulator [Lachnospiraceae bacterium]|nr:helix-turn-helix transcriptional regulator [Lachnospiraceae bacterium]
MAKYQQVSTLGKKLNVSQSMIAQYERGDRTPNDDTLQRIAAILDVSYYELSENNSIENLLRTQENLCHSLQNDRDKIIQEIFEFENELYSIERENWNGAMKDELNKKQKELKEKQKELKYVHSKLEHVEEDIKGLRNYLTEIQDLQEEKRTAQRQEEKDELCKRIEELKANAPDIIKNRATNHIQINTSIKVEDIDVELNSALQKASRRETLTPGEMEKLNDYFQSEAYKNSWKQLKEKMKPHLETMKRIQAAYNQLNKAGLERIAEQIELISKIPEYQKDPETKTAAPGREPQDGGTDTQ